MPYLPGLDGMRALAVVAVMVYHANNTWLAGGFIGVEVFFVISGYLITLLLIGEHERTGRLDLKEFWLRRARRLLPALFVMLALLATFTAVFKRDQLGNLRGDLLAGLGYITNWYQIWVGQGYTASEDFAPLRHLWSLAVEEQFYLLWPLVMLALISLGRRRLPGVALWLAGAAVVVTAVMAVLYTSATPDQSSAYWQLGDRVVSKNDALYLSTITRSGGLLLGAAFAMLWRPVAVMRGPLRNRGRELDVIAFLSLAALGALAWQLHVTYADGRGDPWLYRGGFLAVGVASIGLIAAVTHRGATTGAVLGNPVFRWVGTRSYGLYLFHWPIYQIIRERAGARLTWTEFALAMAITLPITELSYRLVEMPVRKQQVGEWWRRVTERSDPRPRQAVVLGGTAVVAVLAFSAVSMAGGSLKPNEVQQSMRENEESITDIAAALATTTTAASAPVAPDVVDPAPGGDGGDEGGDEPVALTTTVTTTEAPAPASFGNMVAIGDSVMKGAANSLDDVGFVVDAEEARQFSSALPTAEAIAAADPIPEVVVVHLGTNGTIAESDARNFLDALVDVPIVIVLTVVAPGKPWVGDNNSLIQQLSGDYPNVTPGYWHRIYDGCATWPRHESSPADCYASDDIHLNVPGAKYYAAYIDAWVDERRG